MNLKDVRITEGFWKKRKEINKKISFYAILKTFEDSGRIRSLTKDLKDDETHHIFWESDLAKLMETAFFILSHEKDDKLISICDNIIDKIIHNQEDDGYLNCYFSFNEPENKFTNLRVRHELYCAGHLLESAVEHKKLNGDSKFFNAMEKYIDHIANIFGREKGKRKGYPGHQEIELALIKAYEHTNKRKFLNLSNYFISERGKKPHYFDQENIELEKNEEPLDISKLPSEIRDFIRWQHGHRKQQHDYCQAHLPPLDQKTAEGHSVRALYMYTAMADLARINNDKKMLDTCKSLWRNIVDKRMYIHSGLGSAHIGERFSFDYDLPNDMAYAETCATIALIYFADRLNKIELNSEYSDIIENSLYNLILASTSIDGTAFFYDNYLECNPGFLKFQHRRHGIRDKYHICSCCPPNITRLMASVDQYVYNIFDNGLVINQFISSEIDLTDQKQGFKINQFSQFPWEGHSLIEIMESNNLYSTIYIRIPHWEKNLQISVNKEEYQFSTFNGYAKIEKEWKKNDKIELKFDFTPRLIRANTKVRYNIKKASIFRGPILYCLEEVDNGKNLNQILIDDNIKFKEIEKKIDNLKIISLEAKSKRLKSNDTLYTTEKPKIINNKIKLIPYFCWSNRKENEMIVWINES